MRGAAMVEMAIVISLFLVMVLGIIEFAMAFFDWSRTVEATRAGARYAIVHSPDSKKCDLSVLQKRGGFGQLFADRRPCRGHAEHHAAHRGR